MPKPQALVLVFPKEQCKKNPKIGSDEMQVHMIEDMASRGNPKIEITVAAYIEEMENDGSEDRAKFFKYKDVNTTEASEIFPVFPS